MFKQPSIHKGQPITYPDVTTLSTSHAEFPRQQQANPNLESRITKVNHPPITSAVFKIPTNILKNRIGELFSLRRDLP